MAKGRPWQLAVLLALSCFTVASRAAIDCRLVRCDPDFYVPVCAADGRSYSNECVARCLSGVDANVNGTVTPGLCPRDTICSCGKGGTPICDATGKTWDSACIADCASALGPFTDGACPGATPSACQKTRPCLCAGAPFSPVCGSNGQTYPSACSAACDCVDASPGACPCSTAPDSLAPLCGADGRTYQNSQLALCQGVAIAAGRPCVVCPTVRRCATVRQALVCGKDGVTYCSCAASMLRVKVAKRSRCSTSCLGRGAVCGVGSSACCSPLVCSASPGAPNSPPLGTCTPAGR